MAAFLNSFGNGALGESSVGDGGNPLAKVDPCPWGASAVQQHGAASTAGCVML